MWQAFFAFKGGKTMKVSERIRKFEPPVQQSLSFNSPNRTTSKFVSIYRVSLVKDGTVSFGEDRLSCSQQAQFLIQNLILKKGQPDREQFVVAMLNSKNVLIGVNIVSVGGLSSAPVYIREVLKPAIISNSAAIILCHNHPSNNLQPSADDIMVTRKIIHAAEIIGIRVHEHIIINMEDDRYYSFADTGIIQQIYSELS
jgi:DNA repair protein RadC